MKPLGLGIIGLHHQHPRWYYPLWGSLPEYRPVAVAEEDKAFLRSENEFFGLETHTDYHDLLERRDVDAVIVFLPHSRMPQAVADAAAAGKHVIVEKPCAADVAGIEKIAATAREFPHIKISAPYCWRTHPVSGQIRSAIKDGLLGSIVAMEGRLNAGGAHRYIRDNTAWVLESSEGGGPMWNLGVHWIDYFRWMTGQEIVAVSGIANGPFGEPERTIEDNAQALLRFGDGAVGILDVSYSLPDSYPGKRDIYVAFRGTEGDAVWAPAWQGHMDELLLVSRHESASDAQCRRLKIESRDIPGYGGQMAWEWLSDFAAAVREDRAPLVSIDDMRAAVYVADAFYRSLSSGRMERVQA
ncbi:Gfo/Idh/MocA family oxidoreductase [bacterium]|nr:Gfo/Idh/MocA family oxidoreductase [bacterium]